MAKVFGLDESMIDRLGPELDFYFWKGIPCVRMMPRKGRQPGTPAQKETWEALMYANDEYNLLLQNERDAYKYLAAPSQMSGRDLFIKMILQRYQDMGPNYNRVRVRFQHPSPWGYGTYVYKELDSTVVVCAMTSAQYPEVCEWRYIGKTYRGKHVLRRYDLVFHPEKAAFTVSLNEWAHTWAKSFLNSWKQFYVVAMYREAGGSKYGFSGLYRYDPPV